MKKIGSYVRAHHVALLALFVALSGTAYAAGKIGSSDIKSNAVKSKHIAANQVKGSDVKESSLRGVAAGNVYAAWVDNDGQLVRSSGAGVTADQVGIDGSNVYVVQVAGVDLSTCVYQTNMGSPSTTDPAGGFALPEIADDATSVWVRTYDGANAAAERTFSFIAVC